jgi:hypothetical protein
VHGVVVCRLMVRDLVEEPFLDPLAKLQPRKPPAAGLLRRRRR